jgi:hypothetical protein
LPFSLVDGFAAFEQAIKCTVTELKRAAAEILAPDRIYHSEMQFLAAMTGRQALAR